MSLGTDTLAPLERRLAWCNEQPRRWLGVFALLLATQISPWWYPAPDAVVYLSMARSVAFDAHLARFGSRQLGLAPGYPLLISPAFLLGDHPLLALSVVNWILAVLLMLGVYLWVRRCAAPAAVLLTGLVVVNISMLNLCRRNLSERPFMTRAVWSVHVFNAARRATPVRTGFYSVLGGLMLVLLGTIREVGVVFGVGFIAALCVDAYRRRSGARVIAIALIAVLPAALVVLAFMRRDVVMAQQLADQAGTHWDGLVRPAFEGRLIEGLRLRISNIGQLLEPGMFRAYAGPGQWYDVNLLLYVPLAIILAVGWVKLIRRDADVFAWTLPFYLAVYIVWPFDGATRYELPMLPVLLVAGWWAIESQRRWRLRWFAALLVAHLGVALGYWLAIDLPRARQCDAQWSIVERLVQPIGRGTRTVRAVNMNECVRLRLELALDRPAPASDAQSLSSTDAQWAVVGGDADVPGFAVRSRATPFVLLARDRS
jgi:hypothetical protein